MKEFLKAFFFSILFFLFISPCLADFGVHFLMNKRMAVVLDNPDKKISFRFTCLEDMNLLAVSFFCEQVPGRRPFDKSLGQASEQVSQTATNYVEAEQSPCLVEATSRTT